MIPRLLLKGTESQFINLSCSRKPDLNISYRVKKPIDFSGDVSNVDD